MIVVLIGKTLKGVTITVPQSEAADREVPRDPQPRVE